MRIDYFFNGIEFTPYTREQIEKKVEKIATKVPKNTPIKVSFDDNRISYIANIKIHVTGREIIGKGESKNVLTALEQAISRVDRQYVKYIDRNMLRGGEGRIQM